jgi:hypothetical protein
MLLNIKSSKYTKLYVKTYKIVLYYKIICFSIYVDEHREWVVEATVVRKPRPVWNYPTPLGKPG